MGGALYNPAVEQTVLVWYNQDGNATIEINDMLRDGWQVVSVTGAGAGAGAGIGGEFVNPDLEVRTDVYFFVVLERRRS